MAEVVIVDDSQFMRVQIREILQKGGHEVIGEAGNGKMAIDVVEETDPDAVTMDVKMPGMDGIETVETLMDRHPTPVLMLSRYTDEGAETTLEALAAGAIDFMVKPGGEVTTGLVEYADDLVELVSVVSRADVGQIAKEPTKGPETPAVPTLSAHDWGTPPTLVIAASTGGPTEIHELLAALPATVGLRVLIVQHMPEPFTGRFANRLDEVSELTVSEATQNDRVAPNEALVARGDTHLEVDSESGDDLLVSSTDDPPVHSVRPAADITLESAAEVVDGPLLALVLTGMGRDGAAGVEWVDRAGGTVLVQDPATASIASMPEHTIETGVADHVLGTEQVAPTVLDILEERV